MNIGIIGSGYVGLVTSLGLSEKGHKIYNYEIDKSKVNKILNKENYIHEVGVDRILKKNLGKSYFITNNISKLKKCEIFFISVNTPHTSKGINLEFVKLACKKLRQLIKKTIKKKIIIVIKSTVVPGTLKKVIAPIFKKNKNIYIANNPEFLREGSAIKDFMFPDRIVIGSDSKYAKNKLNQVYKNFKTKIFHVSTCESELSKYFSNIFLSTLISFGNEFANICSANNSNYYKILETFLNDRRYRVQYNNKYFYPTLHQYMTPGPGYGGSCFPKDTKSLLLSSMKQNIKMDILKSVVKQNETRIPSIINLLKNRGLIVNGKKILIIGLGFKDGTTDIRETRSKVMIEFLLKKQCKITTYDKKINFEDDNIKNISFKNINSYKFNFIFYFGSKKEVKKFNWKNYCIKNNCYFIDLRGSFNPNKRIYVLGKNL
jgi:UDPglucose 6-dehydrogenase